MAARECALCGEKVGALSARLPLADGVVCSTCINWHDLTRDPSKYQNVKGADLKQYLEARKQYKKDFQITKKVTRFRDKNYIAIDEGHHLAQIVNDYFKFEDILSYELQEDGEILTKGGLGRATVGGLVFGAAGAIVGGVTGGKKSKSVCTDMRIRIALKHPVFSNLYIQFISSPTQKGGVLYRDAQKAADACFSLLKGISDTLESEKAATGSPSVSPISAADEILKYKQLLDADIITQEEFEAKKKQLLGL